VANNLPEGAEDPSDNDNMYEFAEKPYIDEELIKDNFVDWYLRTNPEEFYKHFAR